MSMNSLLKCVSIRCTLIMTVILHYNLQSKVKLKTHFESLAFFGPLIFNYVVTCALCALAHIVYCWHRRTCVFYFLFEFTFPSDACTYYNDGSAVVIFWKRFRMWARSEVEQSAFRQVLESPGFCHLGSLEVYDYFYGIWDIYKTFTAHICMLFCFSPF